MQGPTHQLVGWNDRASTQYGRKCRTKKILNTQFRNYLALLRGSMVKALASLSLLCGLALIDALRPASFHTIPHFTSHISPQSPRRTIWLLTDGCALLGCENQVRVLQLAA